MSQEFEHVLGLRLSAAVAQELSRCAQRADLLGDCRSREDLILSKLVWARDSASELQLRDVRQLLAGPVDANYLHKWAAVLGVESLLENVQR